VLQVQLRMFNGRGILQQLECRRSPGGGLERHRMVDSAGSDSDGNAGELPMGHRLLSRRFLPGGRRLRQQLGCSAHPRRALFLTISAVTMAPRTEGGADIAAELSSSTDAVRSKQG